MRPLPIAVDTVTAWLRKPDSARNTYEGGYNLTGEVEKDSCLRRAYPDYDALVAADDFEGLAHRLIEPLLSALPVKKGKKQQTINATPAVGEA